MQNITTDRNKSKVATWLWIGVFMIIVQVMIGGITRLTESGLSITEWKPITGALPPLNDAAWQQEFVKYKGTDQFKYVHQYFSLEDFKHIFFWEWFHRLWARLLGVVFLAGFIYLWAKKAIHKKMITPLVILFLLGVLQAVVGWIMVQSGLVPQKFYVGHVELTTHLLAAVILLFYTAWFAYSLMPAWQNPVRQKTLRNYIILFTILFFVQLMYGGFMAGLRAAISAPTWPSINGSIVPADMGELQPFSANLHVNPITVQFIHRGLAYILAIVALLFFVKSRQLRSHPLFKKISLYFFGLILLQVLLGILTVMNATNKLALTWLGVTHQTVAMLIVLALAGLIYLLRTKRGI